jgi:hypothetical protein
MNEKRVIVTIVCALAVAVPVTAAGADDPLAQTKADLAKLTADTSAAKSTLAADGSDMAQLRRDAKKGLFTLKADWKLLLADAKAARKSGADKKELRALMGAARTQLKGFRSAVRTAYTQAAKQNKGLHGSKSSPGSKGKHSGQGSDDDGSGG